MSRLKIERKLRGDVPPHEDYGRNMLCGPPGYAVEVRVRQPGLRGMLGGRDVVRMESDRMSLAQAIEVGKKGLKNRRARVIVRERDWADEIC